MRKRKAKSSKESLYHEITHHHRYGTSKSGYLAHEISEKPVRCAPDDRYYVDEDIWETPNLPKLGAKIMIGFFFDDFDASFF